MRSAGRSTHRLLAPNWFASPAATDLATPGSTLIHRRPFWSGIILAVYSRPSRMTVKSQTIKPIFVVSAVVSACVDQLMSSCVKPATGSLKVKRAMNGPVATPSVCRSRGG